MNEFESMLTRDPIRPTRLTLVYSTDASVTATWTRDGQVVRQERVIREPGDTHDRPATA